MKYKQIIPTGIVACPILHLRDCACTCTFLLSSCTLFAYVFLPLDWFIGDCVHILYRSSKGRDMQLLKTYYEKGGSLQSQCSVGSGSSSSKRMKLDSSGDYFISKYHVNQMFISMLMTCACIIMQKQRGLPSHR